MTNGAPFAPNAQLRLLGPDGSVIEFDEDDGSLAASSPSIAGAAIPATGTYYLQGNATRLGYTIRPYDLLLAVRSGTPVAETEPNDAPAGADSLVGGFVAGGRPPAGHV